MQWDRSLHAPKEPVDPYAKDLGYCFELVVEDAASVRFDLGYRGPIKLDSNSREVS